MAFLIRVLIALITICSVQLEIIGADENTDTRIAGLSSLFDVTENDEGPQENKRNIVCDTDACQIIATEFKRGMNTSVAPCDNFYDFVCGAWEDLDQLPGYTAIWSRFHIFQYTVNRRIKGILETEPETTDILPVRQAKKWYRACMDIEALDKRGLKPLESILLQVGGWPMTLDPEEWNEHEHSWQSVEHDYFHITGTYVFYKFRPSWRDNSTITLTKGAIPLYRKFPPEYRNYTGEDYEAYTEFISGVTQMFVEYNKAAITAEMIDADVRDLVEFEKQLYMISESSDDEYSEWTLGDFIEWYNTNSTDTELDTNTTKIDFEHLLRRQFDLVNLQMNDSVSLNVDSSSYYVQLTELLNQTPTRTIVNYLHWHFVSDMLTYTTELMRDAFFTLMKNEFDVKERPPRWLECIDEMKMTTAAAYAFVGKYFSQEVEKAAREMIENVRAEMMSQVNESGWMDEDSKAIAREKLNDMKVFVGYPDWYKNQTAVANAYKGLTIAYDHFDNVLSFKKYMIKKVLRGDDSQFDNMAGDDPIMINAFYNPMGNAIVLPTANFQPPLFTSRVPPSVNYGTIGLAAGHEMGHGFDNNGILFGKDGNKTELSENMLEMFEERAHCFVEQFNKYFGDTDLSDSDKSSRGYNTLADNMADSTGLQSVFKSFQRLIVDHSVDNYKLPGFEEYTDDQMFFISSAAIWCETVTPKFAKKRETSDVHSPGRFRVIGPLKNLNDFAQAFNCPKGSPMNPEKKCNIWK